MILSAALILIFIILGGVLPLVTQGSVSGEVIFNKRLSNVFPF